MMNYERLLWGMVIFAICFLGGIIFNFVCSVIEAHFRKSIDKKKRRYMKYGIKYYKSDLERVLDK